MTAGLAGIHGLPVGVIITRDGHPLGTDGLRKMARVVAVCHRFELPLVVLQDCAGYAET